MTLHLIERGTDKPLAIDLFCGLFGWSEGLIQEGWRIVGFDVEDVHKNLGIARRSDFQLVIQDVRSLHGFQFRDARLLVASPPCQFFSYCSMPWSKARERAERVRASPELLASELELFLLCFRIQAEACAAAGRHIPMIVENVAGAQPWVGKARYRFGSFCFWGDVPALMPIRVGGFKSKGLDWSKRDQVGNDFTRVAGAQLLGIKNDGGSWFNVGSPGQKVVAQNGRDQLAEGLEFGGTWWNDSTNNLIREASSKSTARKAASALIAKIPPPIARHIARTYR